VRRNYFPRSLIIFACLVFSAFAQLEKIVIPAGTPEDQGLQAISKEEDAQKKATMYEEFVQKFSSNPAAVAYGNWQLSQYHQGAGDLQKSLDYGDKALVSAPHNLDILVSQPLGYVEIITTTALQALEVVDIVLPETLPVALEALFNLLFGMLNIPTVEIGVLMRTPR